MAGDIIGGTNGSDIASSWTERFNASGREAHKPGDYVCLNLNAFMDAQVGRILKALDELGLRDCTLVIFTSDHGYHLGDHGCWQSANLHEQVIRVPLIISLNGMRTGHTRAIAELVDIYPSACDVTGIETPGEVQGESLLPVLRNEDAAVRDAALSLSRGNLSLRTARWQYIGYASGEEELYDMASDPQQFDNLAASAQAPEQLRDLRQKLEKDWRI